MKDRFEREIKRRKIKKRQAKAMAIHKKYTRYEDLQKCECKKHKKVAVA